MSPRSFLRHAIQEFLSPSRQSRSSRSRKASRQLRLESLEPRLAMAVYAVQEPTALFGNLDQHALSYAYPQFGSGAASIACCPTAATNSLAYLQNAFPSLYGNSLVATASADLDNSGAVNAYDSLVQTAGSSLASSTYMNTAQPIGTWHHNFVTGLSSYVEAKSPGHSQYLAQDYWGVGYSAGQPRPAWTQGQAPTWSFLYDTLSRKAAVDVLLQFSADTRGHYLSVTGMTWDTSVSGGTLAYVNPWNGRNEQVGIRLSSGLIYTDYNGTNGSWIGTAEAVVPFATVAENTPIGSVVASLAAADTSTTYTLVPTTGIETQATPWMRMSTFLTYCSNQNAARSYPLTIEGRVNPQDGYWECRGVFEPWISTGIAYRYEWGRTQQETASYNAQHTAQGFSVLSQQTFRDAGNNSIYQTVWVRDGLSTAKQHLATLQSTTIPNDNAAFTILGNQLKTAKAFDYETKSAYTIRVRATQPGGSYTETTLVIGVTNVNEAPTNISLTASSVRSSAARGTIVGSFLATDPDAGDQFTYALVDGTGAADNGRFVIVGNQLRTGAAFGTSTKNSCTIRVRVTDAGGLWTEKVFTLTLT